VIREIAVNVVIRWSTGAPEIPPELPLMIYHLE
jgi:hypothetical protein